MRPGAADRSESQETPDATPSPGVIEQRARALSPCGGPRAAASRGAWITHVAPRLASRRGPAQCWSVLSSEDLGRLLLLGELGRGAMGVVHRAFDPALGREVALKVLLAGNPARLEREGVVAAGLDHPGIVRVHRAGHLAGRPCLVYELVEGARTLDEVLGSADLPAAAALLRDVARALGHAHARGVVHRDVKPGNVLVGSDGRPRVTDLGLAAAKELDRLTQTGEVLGTPLYMAPETLTGQRERVGPAADVWAVGVMLYERVTGQVPFSGDSLLTLSVQVLEAPLPRPPAGAAAPAPLWAICERALAKDPDDRYPTGDALADDLDAYLAGREVTAGHAWRARRRTRALLASGALVAAALAGGGIVVALRGAPPAPPVRRVLATPAPSPQAPPAPDPGAAWRRIEAERDRLEQHRAARSWLAQHPGHPLAPTARIRLGLLAERPLARVVVSPGGGEVDVAAARDGRWLAASEVTGEVACFDGARELWRRSDASSHGGVASRGRGALWWGAPGLNLWWADDLDRGAVSGRASGGDGRPRHVALSPDGARAAVAPATAEVVLVDLASAGGARRLPAPARAHGLSFSPDGALVAAALGGEPTGTGALPHAELRVWSVEAGAVLGSAPALAMPLAVAFAPDGASVAFGGADGEVRTLTPDLRPLAVLAEVGRATLGELPGAVRALAWSPDGQTLYAASMPDRGAASQLVALDPATGARRWTAALADGVVELAVAHDGELLLLATTAGAVEVWSAR